MEGDFFGELQMDRGTEEQCPVKVESGTTLEGMSWDSIPPCHFEGQKKKDS